MKKSALSCGSNITVPFSTTSGFPRSQLRFQSSRFFGFLGVLRKPSWLSALAGLTAGCLVAAGLYGLPPDLIDFAVGYGAAFGIFPIPLETLIQIRLGGKRRAGPDRIA